MCEEPDALVDAGIAAVTSAVAIWRWKERSWLNVIVAAITIFASAIVIATLVGGAIAGT